MDDLLQFVPEEKHEEFKGAAQGYVRLTDELAYEHVRGSQSLRDKIAAPEVEAYKKNYAEKKLPEILAQEREKIRKELNPEETEADKRIRAIEEENAALKREREVEKLQKALRAKSKELGYPVELAENLSVYGDNAVTELERRAGIYTASIQDGVDKAVKARLAGSPPSGGTTPSSADIDNQIREARKSGATQRAMRLQRQKDSLQQG